ncbi:hypothetical protein ACFPK1_20845 [Actinomycetospora rhizophila]|uniref:Uncharacterized protein n=1 Tax=Actinomycetospora rhizophila TaxID=1416876 RepID=A0ABV9ZGJ9_9PSEU
MSWVLIGLGVWLVVAVAGALAVALLVRANRPTTLDVLRARGVVQEPSVAPSDPRTDARDGTGGADLPAPRDGGHDRAAAPTERRRD